MVERVSLENGCFVRFFIFLQVRTYSNYGVFLFQKGEGAIDWFLRREEVLLSPFLEGFYIVELYQKDGEMTWMDLEFVGTSMNTSY